MKTIKILTYPLKIKSFKDQKQVFDPVRNKYVAFTPEEFVRQNIIMHFIHTGKYSKSLMSVEYMLKYMDTRLRCDLVLFNKRGEAKMIVECKAPTVKITQTVIDQAALYNSKLRVEYLLVSNGTETICCQIDYDQRTYFFLEDLPEL